MQSSFDLKKIKSKFQQLGELLGVGNYPDELLDKMLKVIQAQTFLDLVDLTQESTEKKIEMRNLKVPLEEIKKTITSELNKATAEDVALASLQRSMEILIKKTDSPRTAETLAQAEHFIANITKEDLRPDGYDPNYVEPQVTPAVQAVPTPQPEVPAVTAPQPAVTLVQKPLNPPSAVVAPTFGETPVIT
jgi:hypothetical protein